jgi:hypothetical protein
VRQHTNAGRIEPHFLEGRRSLELVEDRALSRRPGKLDELKLRSLASFGFKLHRFSSIVQLSKLVYVFLRL